jgi:hypothetical protein
MHDAAQAEELSFGQPGGRVPYLSDKWRPLQQQ